MQILFTAISLCAPIASGLAMAFPVFALTVYQDRAEDPGGGDGGGGNPDNPLVRPLDTEQGSWFGQQFPMLNLQMMNELEHALSRERPPADITVTLVTVILPSFYFLLFRPERNMELIR